MMVEWPLKHSGPCACQYVRSEDYGDTEQTEWCGLHAKQRDELERLKAIEQMALIVCRADRWNLPDAIADLAVTCGVEK